MITAVKSTQSWYSSGKRHEFFGTAILLCAFVTQVTFVRYADSERRTWDTSSWTHMADRLLALAEVDMYFTSGQTTENYDGKWLHQAAMDEVNGLAGRTAVAGLDKQTKIKKIRELLARANSVTDLDSYNSFVEKIEPDEAAATQAGAAFELTRLGRLESEANWFYFGLYFVGSALVLRGLWQEGHSVNSDKTFRAK